MSPERNFTFVCFTNKEDATKAAVSPSKYELGGKKMKVKRISERSLTRYDEMTRVNIRSRSNVKSHVETMKRLDNQKTTNYANLVKKAETLKKMVNQE